MPATPAWPPKSTPRLYVEQSLAVGAEVALDGNAAHYLANVMRLGPGSPVRLFDDRTGEYLAETVQASKRHVTLTVAAKLRDRETTPDFWLCAAPIKKPRFDWMAEKACELGVSRFVPVLTSRCVVDKVKPDRLMTQMIEAAEQCERTALPEISALVSLRTLLDDWPEGRTLHFADERLHEMEGDSGAQGFADGPAALFIGPEGGFTDEENNLIRKHPACRPISLGPRILRAETAAICGISAWMVNHGDWN